MTLHGRFVAGLLLGIVIASTGIAGAAPGLDDGTSQVNVQRIRAAQASLEHNPPLAERVRALMLRQAEALIDGAKPWDAVPGSLSLTENKSNEHSVRPNARTLYGLAVMVRSFDDADFPTTLTRVRCLEAAKGLARSILYTHRAGGIKCTDGKLWFDQWQSALWANSAGIACWLLWDELSAEEKQLATQMVADEADRFIDLDPPSRIENDTKAEENAWNSTVISLAACMLPEHPNNAAWKKAAVRWNLSSFIRQADVNSSQSVDGGPIASYRLGPTLHDDYTMENHNRVHPDYMNTIHLTLDQWLVYHFAGLPAPDATLFNTRHVYGTLRALTFPDAGYLYVNGQDWQLHRNCQWFMTHLEAAHFFDDPGAAFIARRALETGELMMARRERGGAFLDEEFSFPSAQMDYLEMLATMHLLLRQFGEGPPPVSEQEYWQGAAGTYLHEWGKFGVTRTTSSAISFSWGKQVMGMALPLQKDLLLAPNERSLIGTVTIAGKPRESPSGVAASAVRISGGFAVGGSMQRGGGTFIQKFSFAALPGDVAVYIDRLEATTATASADLKLGTLSVLNDRHWVYHDGQRKLYLPDETLTLDVRTEKEGGDKLKLESPWYNLDDKLGVLVLHSSGRQEYHANRKIGNGRLEQLFSLNAVGTLSNVEAGQIAAETVLVLLPGQGVEATRKASEEYAVAVEGEVVSVLYRGQPVLAAKAGEVPSLSSGN